MKLTKTMKDDLKKNIGTNSEWEVTNKDFFQIYNNSTDIIIQLIEINPLSAKIFLFFCKEMESNNTIIIKTTDLEKIFNRDKRSIYRAIKTLIEYNVLTIIRDGRQNVYFINPMFSCSVGAEYKRKLIHEYNKLVGEVTPKTTDRTIINTDEYNKQNQLTYKIRFYKKHPELQKPTQEEVLERLDAILEEEKTFTEPPEGYKPSEDNPFSL